MYNAPKWMYTSFYNLNLQPSFPGHPRKIKDQVKIRKQKKRNKRGQTSQENHSEETQVKKDIKLI